jgi:NTP pyrophosphatase (non-canonical NTP hydrolase)
MSDFDSVGLFHKKFGLATSADGPPRELTAEELRFRFKFLLEELLEFADAMGIVCTVAWDAEPCDPPESRDLPKAADALIDLSYVVLGTAHLMRLPWAALFADVQRANMTKERCGINHAFDQGIPSDVTEAGPEDYCLHPGEQPYCGEPKAKHSLRGSAFDVIKPEGWQGPQTIEVLMKADWLGPKLPMGEE